LTELLIQEKLIDKPNDYTNLSTEDHTRSLAREFSKSNIPVYAIAPGAVSGSHQPGSLEETVNTLTFLLTSGSRSTGQTLHVTMVGTWEASHVSADNLLRKTHHNLSLPGL
jgi:short-subunit dehydrogenase